MGPELIIAILAAVSALSNIGATAAANKKNRQNTLADWNTANQYNSPKEQMQRFSDAGLNPKLIYGQTNVAQQIPTKAVEPLPMSGLTDVIGKYVDTRQAKTSMALQEQQIESAKTIQELNEVKIIGEIIANNRDLFKGSTMEQEFIARMRNVNAKSDNIEMDTKLKGQSMDLNTKYYDLALQKYEQKNREVLLKERSIIVAEKNHDLAYKKFLLLKLKTMEDIARSEEQRKVYQSLRIKMAADTNFVISKITGQENKNRDWQDMILSSDNVLEMWVKRNGTPLQRKMYMIGKGYDVASDKILSKVGKTLETGEKAIDIINPFN